MKYFKQMGGFVLVFAAAGATAQSTDMTAPPNASAVVAKVNGEALTASQVSASLRQAGLPDNETTRNARVSELIAAEVVRQAAEKADYGTRPEVQQAVAQARARAETELYLREHARPAAISDAQVKARYDEIVASLGDKEYKPRIIVVGDLATAKMIGSRLKQGGDFAQLAKEFSLLNRGTGGEMEWVSFKMPLKEGQTQGVPLAVAQALVALPTGGVSQSLIPVASRYVLLKLDAMRPTQIPAYDVAKAQLRQQLEAAESQKAISTAVEVLLRQAKIER